MPNQFALVEAEVRQQLVGSASNRWLRDTLYKPTGYVNLQWSLESALYKPTGYEFSVATLAVPAACTLLGLIASPSAVVNGLGSKQLALASDHG